MKIARRLWSLSNWLILTAALSACTRHAPESAVKFKFSGSAFQSLSAVPDGRATCFGVDIAGDGISSARANACSPPVALFAGFVIGGSSTELSLSVPKGSNRLVRVLLYLPPVGTTTCPTFTSASDFAKLDPKNLFVAGKVTGVDTNSDVSLTIDADFPGLENSIAANLNLPTNCPSSISSLANIANATVSAGKYGVAAIQFTLDKAPTSTAYLDFTTVNGTAHAGVDFIGGNGRASVLAGQTTGTIVVPLMSAHAPTGPLDFQVQLTGGNGISPGALTQATVTLTDAIPAARSDWVKISSVEGHVCALNTAGAMYCWGYSNSGNIGDGTQLSRAIPTPVNGLSSGVVDIDAGNYGSCAVMADGTAKCWGSNDYGQLGDGTTNNQTAPVTVAGLSGVTQIQRGFLQTCALLNTGGVKCWGMNLYGQLGNGTNIDSPTPVTPGSLSSGVTEITVNFHSACALLAGGGVQCWGLNSGGGLGNGTTSDVYGVTTPTNPTGLTSGVSHVSLGTDYGCALLSDTTVKCWGSNYNGRVGNGTTADQLSPVAVTGLSGVVQIATGSGHACALLSDQSVKCWGGNMDGQIDNTANAQYLAPVTISGLSGVSKIVAGNAHTCALLSTGQIKCLGSNMNGQLGLGEFTSLRARPTARADLNTAPISTVDIGGGYYGLHLCAVRGGGALCWGTNSSGELGDGTTTSRSVPASVSGLASGVSAISAGDSHSCALLTSGLVKCWGSNSSGQLGDGTNTSSSVPVNVALGATAVQLASTASSTCALLSNHTVKCWGFNYDGRLGIGTDVSSSSPVAIPSLTGVTQIAAGGSNACALTAAGGIFCWGANYNGQLGDGSTSGSFSPVAVTGLSAQAKRVSVGGSFVCALLADASAMCWGGNYQGQLGDGTTIQKVVPVPVTGLATGKTLSDISAGGSHTCALFTDGAVQCWGDNGSGQLGDGTQLARSTPAAVPGLNGSKSLKAASANTCALTEGGAAICWGQNTGGELDTFSTKAPHLVFGP